jgi:hypothetical protein
VPGPEAYFDSPTVRTTLGDDLPWVISVDAQSTAVTEALRWLGVREHPRAQDLLARVTDLTTDPPNATSVQTVQAIVRYVGAQAPELGLWQRLDELRRTRWLPARGDETRWYEPGEIYSEFSRSLFASQARFLDVPVADQQRTSDYLKFLGVQSEPTPALVVRHLRYLVEHGQVVGTNVYDFLERNAGDPTIELLRGQPCLVLGGRAYRADQVYWAEHSFDPFRKTLAAELRQYGTLLARLGVKEAPDHTDAIAVLKEVSADAGTRPLSDKHAALTNDCWRILDRALDDDNVDPDDLETLRSERVIPNPRGVLEKPEWLYFEDRPGLARDLGPLLANNVIGRLPGAWRAMRAAGVRDLGKASELHLVECRSPRPDDSLRERLNARRASVMRVMEAQTADTDDIDNAVYDSVRCLRVDALRVQFSLRAFGGRQAQTDPADYHAVFVRDEDALYFVARNGTPPWRDIARELAYAVFPGLEPGGPASGMKDALEAETAEEAGRILDELGYPRLADDVPAERTAAEPLAFAPSQGTDWAEDWDAYEPAAPQDTDGGAGRTEEDDATGVEDGGAGAPGTGTHGDGRGRSDADGRPSSSAGRRPQTRLRSYVAPGDDPSDATTEDRGDEDPTDPAGVSHVMAAERSAGRHPTEMPHHHPGYDIESRSEPNGPIERYIEVKSTADVWGDRGVALSRTQFERARELGPAYWLYVVERANADEARIFRIQDPANRAMWYFFDDGWRVVDGSVGAELIPGGEPETA